MAAGLPVVEIGRNRLEQGLGILSLAVETGFVKTNGEARRAIVNQALSINDEKVDNPKRQISSRDFSNEGICKISFGKKKHALVKLIDSWLVA